MCCISHSTEKKKIAKRDIFVYKHLEQRKKGDGTYRKLICSPILRTRWTIGLVKKAKGFDSRDLGIYCYPKLSHAPVHESNCLFKAVIPKGTEYYIGEHATGNGQLVIRSNALKILHKVDVNTGRRLAIQ